MTRKTIGLIMVIASALGLAACSSAPHRALAQHSTTTTQAQLNTAPRQCRDVGMTSLGTRSVVLNPARSVTTRVAGNRVDIRCAYDNAGTHTEAGTISLTSYVKSSDAQAAYNSSRQTYASLGADLAAEHYGQAAFALSQGSSWTCLILSGSHIASAALAAGDATSACHWAQLGLDSL